MIKSKTKVVGTKFFNAGTQNQKILQNYWGTGKTFTTSDLKKKPPDFFLSSSSLTNLILDLLASSSLISAMVPLIFPPSAISKSLYLISPFATPEEVTESVPATAKLPS